MAKTKHEIPARGGSFLREPGNTLNCVERTEPAPDRNDLGAAKKAKAVADARPAGKKVKGKSNG